MPKRKSKEVWVPEARGAETGVKLWSRFVCVCFGWPRDIFFSFASRNWNVKDVKKANNSCHVIVMQACTARVLHKGGGGLQLSELLCD